MSSDKAKKEKDIVAFKTKLYPTKRQKEYFNRFWYNCGLFFS